MKSSKNTVAKTTIYNLILNASVALSHADIQRLVGNLCDRVTIYRVLERLLNEGLIHKIVTMDGITRYAGQHNETSKKYHYHVHFSCQKCKAVTCLEEVKPSFKIPKNYLIKDMNFTLSGLCPKCL